MATWQNREVAVLLAQGLAKCDIVKKDNEILANTIDQQYVMMKKVTNEVKDCFREVQKRDDVIDRQELEKELLTDMNKELKADLRKTSRQLKWKKIEGWGKFIFGVGLGGFVTYKLSN